MADQLFEVASPFDETDLADALIDMLAEEGLDAQEIEVNARRALTENAERLRLARAL